MANIEKRISKNGKVSYRVKIRIKGTPPMSETFTSLTKAREWASKTETRIKDGVRFSILEARKRTLGELIEQYETNVLPHKKTSSAVDTARHLKEWRRRIGDRYLLHITPALISKTREEIATSPEQKKRKSNSTLNRYMAALSVVFSYGVNELEWLEVNPVSKVHKLSEPAGRVRCLSDAERESLLSAVQEAGNPYLYPAVLVAITTGARRMEILSLKWEDVDLNAARAVLHNTKNGERRGLPLVEPALGALRELYKNRGNSPFVFPSRDGTQPFDIKRSWDKAIATAGVENFRFHDLRHTCASYLIMNSVTMGEISELLGHKTLQMTKRYAHLFDNHKHSVVEKMSTKIFKE